jgi:biotin-(acetyl-CoA carboxylase) ligase
LEAFGIKSKIKWPNYIYVNDKKICGILIENTFSGKLVDNSVVGIGLNVNNVLPIELCEIATTMVEVLGKETPIALVEEKLLKNLALPVSMDEYEARLGYLGAPVNLLVGEEILTAIPQGVTKKGELIALINGEKRIFPSAEVSLRIK